MENEKTNLKLEVLGKLSDLIIAGLGLVAALAWNEAILELFKKIFGTQSTVLAKFLYALIITILIVCITVKLGGITNKVKEKINK